MNVTRLIQIVGIGGVSVGTPTVYFSVMKINSKKEEDKGGLLKRFSNSEEAKAFWLNEDLGFGEYSDANLGTAVFYDRYWIDKDEEFESKTESSKKSKEEIKKYCGESKNEVIEINRESVDGDVKVKYRKKGETEWKEYLEDVSSIKEAIDLCTNNYTYEHIYKDRIIKDAEWERFYKKIKERVGSIVEENSDELKTHCDSEKIRKYSIKAKSSDFWMKCTKWEGLEE